MKDTIVSPPDVRQGPNRLRTLRTKRRPIPHSETIFSYPHNPLPLLSHSAPAESRYGRFRHCYPKLPPKQEETALIRKPRHPSTDARTDNFRRQTKKPHTSRYDRPATYRIRNAEKVYDHKKDIPVRTETGQPAHIAGRGNKTGNHDARTKSPRKRPATTSFNDPKFRRRSTARSDSPSRPPRIHSDRRRPKPEKIAGEKRKRPKSAHGKRDRRIPSPRERIAYQFIGSRPMLLR